MTIKNKKAAGIYFKVGANFFLLVGIAAALDVPVIFSVLALASYMFGTFLFWNSHEEK